MSIPKTPVEFDYDLWTTEEGKCMVRIKATGEITEVERSVMQVLRSEEKRLRRTISPEQGPSREGKTAPTVLSLDMLPEDVADSSWLADTYDYTEEISTKLLERSLRESLTPTQYGIYQACILNGISYKASTSSRFASSIPGFDIVSNPGIFYPPGKAAAPGIFPEALQYLFRLRRLRCDIAAARGIFSTARWRGSGSAAIF